MYSIRAIERAFKLLECFTLGKPNIGVTELASFAGLSKATTFRIAETLEKLGYLNKDESSQAYSVSAKVLGIGQVFLDNLDFRIVATPYMKKIRDNLDETISLYVNVNNKRVCVERFNSSQSLRRVVTVGDEVPLDRGASGKVLIAFSNLKFGVDEMLLEKIRNDGYAYTSNERGLGISAISVPIHNYKGELIAALTISGSSIRFNDESLPHYIKIMIETAAEISAKLGYKKAGVVDSLKAQEK